MHSGPPMGHRLLARGGSSLSCFATLTVILAMLEAAAAGAACGGSRDSTFDPQHDANQGSNDDPAFTNPLAPGGVFAACANATADATIKPANLVIMYDRSGSMGDTTNDPPFDPNLKWNPVSTGMKAFFADPGSANLNASLQFFPVGDTVDQVCSYDYAKPDVPLTPLTASSSFAGAIDDTRPQGGTPTLPAVQGAIAYAKTVAAQMPRDATSVVLVTDGEPGIVVDDSFQDGCPGNNIDHVAAVARDAYQGTPSIHTYVIGVGPALDKLNAIAAGGGTGKAIMVDIQDPQKTTGLFQKALEQVRSQTLACDLDIPQAPAGKTLDPNQVNVVYASGGKYQVLGYDAACTGGAGWRYDDAASPKKIVLCPTMCGAAQSDRDGSLKLAFGCQTTAVIH
jgi:hypothetical protein